MNSECSNMVSSKPLKGPMLFIFQYFHTNNFQESKYCDFWCLELYILSIPCCIFMGHTRIGASVSFTGCLVAQPTNQPRWPLSGLVPGHQAGDLPIQIQDENPLHAHRLCCCNLFTDPIWRLFFLLFVFIEGFFWCIVTVSSVRGWRWGEHSVLWPLQAEAKAEASVATEAPAAKLQTNKLLRPKKETSCGGGSGRGQPKHKVATFFPILRFLFHAHVWHKRHFLGSFQAILRSLFAEIE